MGAVVPSLSGISVRYTFDAIEEMVGAGVIRSALSQLPVASREQFEQATAVSWIPMSVVAQVVNEIARLTHRDPEQLIDEAVRRGVQNTFKSVWRTLLRVTTDEALIARAAIIYSKARNIGQLHVSVPAPGHAELRLSDWPEAPARHVRTIGIAMQVILELAGRRVVRVKSTRTHDGAVYHLTWQG
jgi:hypothetical protein